MSQDHYHVLQGLFFSNFIRWISSNCSQSGAVHFRDMSLGDLSKINFWDAYYDYDVKNFESYLNNQFAKNEKNDCRCDRKQHTFNKQFLNLNLKNI